MNILWDFRLFSHGYGERGVGQYTIALSKALLSSITSDQIIVWGNRECVPEPIRTWPVHWIPYLKGDWKTDLFTIPLLIAKHKIDLFHYWIALGPLHQFGIGLFHPCRTVATVYDLGVELWDVPFLRHVRSCRYWAIQKSVFRSVNQVVCISDATRSDLKTVLPSFRGKTSIAYMPFTTGDKHHRRRQSYLFTLGGSPHKNVVRVVTAFQRFKTLYPDFDLIILGNIDKTEECLEKTPDSVQFEPSMERYSYHLNHASALLFCSTNEGLGIPPLEAMSCGCPILLSDIRPLRETCTDAAVFVNPFQEKSIADGMMELVSNHETWIARSQEGFRRYQEMSSSAAKVYLRAYQSLRG